MLLPDEIVVVVSIRLFVYDLVSVFVNYKRVISTELHPWAFHCNPLEMWV